MPLRNILLEIASTLGLDDLTDADRRSYYIDKINTLGEELYRDYELPGTLMEHVFQVNSEDLTSSQIAFPYYVGEVRGIRIFDTLGGKIRVNTLKPRYNAKAWGNDTALRWREKTRNGFFKRELQDFSSLTFTLKELETTDVVIDVSGRSDISEKTSEVVTIPAGQFSATTVNSYIEATFTKRAINTYNITVTDINNNEISEIPNFLTRPYYTVLQFQDNNIFPGVSNNYDTFEVLYKKRYIPMSSLADEFVAPDCDRLLYWKFAEWWESTQPGHEDRAILAKAKLDDLVFKLMDDVNNSKEIELSFGENRFIAAQKSSYDALTNPYSNRYIG